MVYDVARNNEMKAYIEKAITTSGQRTRRAISAFGQETEAGLDSLKLAMELTIQRQLGELVQEIRSVVRDELRARDGKK